MDHHRMITPVGIKIFERENSIYFVCFFAVNKKRKFYFQIDFGVSREGEGSGERKRKPRGHKMYS